MRTPSISRGLVFALALGAVLVTAASALQAQSANNAAIHLKKDSNGLFLLTIRDPDGIREFSLEPATKGPYGGAIQDCPRIFQSANVLFTDPADFTPVMNASVTDCAGNVGKLEIPPPQSGAASSRRLAPPAAPTPPPPPAAAPQAAPPPAGGGAAESAAQGGDEARHQAAKAGINYPVAELGGCANEAACRAYCDEIANIKVCVDFAERNGLIGKDEAERGRKFAAAGGRGPGGCRSNDQCVAYCESIEHIEECLAFAEKNGFLEGEELRQAQIVARLKREQVAFPGGCTSKAACETYCQEAAHIDECLAFGERSGLIPPEELAMAKKMLPLIKAGRTPGGCSRKETCEAYCQQPANIRQCLAFAEEQGLIPAEELAMAKKFLPLLEQGTTPGGCRSKESCEAYCADPARSEECLSFAERAGFIRPEEAELARKTGGKGPGGCKSSTECEAYCADPANRDACADFAVKAGLVTPQEAELTKVLGCGSRQECEAMCAKPENQERCASALGIPIGPPGGGDGRGDRDRPPGTEGQGPEAEERIREETRERTREETERVSRETGIAQCRAAIAGVPPAVLACLERRHGSVDAACDPPSAISGRITACVAEVSAPPAGSPTAPATQPEGSAPPPAGATPTPSAVGPQGTRIDCSLFAAAPRCEFAAPVGSDNYNYCKQCFPER